MDCRWVSELFFQRCKNHTVLIRKHVFREEYGESRGGSRAAATYKMQRFVITDALCDVAAVLDLSLSLIYLWHFRCFIFN